MREARKVQKRRNRGVVGRPPGVSAAIGRTCPGRLDRMDVPKGPGVCRIYFQNTCTMKIGFRLQESGEALKVLNNLEVDLVGLTEINKNLDHPVVKNQVERTFRENMKDAKIGVAMNKEYLQDLQHIHDMQHTQCILQMHYA